MVILKFVHYSAFIFWYGTLLYFTFFQAPILFKTLPRDLFGEVQTRLFPSYYVIGYVCGTLTVVTYNFLHPLRDYVPSDCVKLTALCLMLLFSLGQGLWAGPRAAKIRLERLAAREAKDEDRVKSLSRRFGQAHGISSLFNLIVVLSGTLYLAYWLKDMKP